jgi:ABC-2 type transport system permease protein
MKGWRTLFPNAWYVAVREYRGRARSRSFVIGTVLLALISFAATQIPVLIDLSLSTSQTRLVIVDEAGLPGTSQMLLDTQLNGASSDDQSAHKDYLVSWIPAKGLPAAQADLEAGRYDILVDVKPDGTKDIQFVVRTDSAKDGRTVQAVESALYPVAIEYRLAMAGTSIENIQKAPAVVVTSVNGAASSGNDLSKEISTSLLSTGLIVLIFMAIVTYGVWVAMSVAEEKGSRVMELMLNATTPLQMLAGKMLGNGGAGLTQYGIILVAVVGGLLAQGPIHHAVVGTDSGTQFGGLSPAVLGAFVVLFILGFTLYSLLYAALGSLVSRQEDVQSATSPLMVLIMAGYFMSVAGLQAIDETWVRVASFVPFFSPYLMLARVSAGHVEPWEFGLAVVLLVASIVVALFVAARIYSAGVLLYGQRVSLRQVLKAARVSR